MVEKFQHGRNHCPVCVWVQYSFHYFKQLESNSVATYILYFGYMALICFGLYLITGGTVGLLSALWFNKKIFGSIKIDKID